MYVSSVIYVEKLIKPGEKKESPVILVDADNNPATDPTGTNFSIDPTYKDPTD